MSSHHRPLLPLLLLLLLSYAGNSTDPSQCSSLLNLKRSFSSADLGTWKPDTDCCGWDGVLCDPVSGLVVALDLSHRVIAGKLTAGLFNITSLRKLNLAYNVFDEIPIPNEIGSLLNLTHLNLSNAGFAGQVPVGIAKLTNLVSLDLSTISLVQSSLSLVNPNLETLIGNLSELRELNLDSVNISANGHRWGAAVAKSTPKLTALSLTSCSITGPIDSSLSKLSNLSVVRLDQNELNCGVPDFFGKLSSLSVVSLSFCGLTGIFPKDVFVLKNLTNIDLSYNLMLSGSLPDIFSDSRLNSLVLSGSNFTGYLPNSIGKLKSLTRMDLSDCEFSGVIPFSVGNLSQVVHLDLSMNNFTGPIPSLLPPRVSELILSHNRLTGPIPSSIGKLEHAVKIDFLSLFAFPLLQEVQLSMNQLLDVEELKNGSSHLATVDLSNNLLQGEIPRSVFQLSGLKVLTLASNNFSGTVEVDWFTALSNLSSLDLSNNRISVEDKGGNGSIPKFGTLMLATCNLTRIPSFLMHQDQMGILDLSNNKIHGAIPNWIWNIGKNSLTYLNLSFNMFTSVEGPLPKGPLPKFKKNTAITLDLHSNLLKGPIPLPPTNAIILDYSNNSFSSFIPPELTSYLNFTIFFSLAHNNITGEIPPSICNAINLQVLDFSDNNLNGLIPPCLLESYNELGVLNLGENHLRGSILWNISEECGLRTINL
ncbi:probably inactive leucine-rich repeat receptor-like protein kinase At2g25790 [Asparagus officinalis]|nr:probably inactive leucine-rich repeat receptor-like protein kinase At2g25790 [Asparagus officinalis]